ncbi:MAG: Bax inhibitor-1/YccA family protein [Flavitalea sp.]
MDLFKSGNPVLSEKKFEKTIDRYDNDVMTKSGTLNKFGLMMILVIASAGFVWKAFEEGKNVIPWVLAGAIGGFIVALVLMFKPMWASFLAPVYALLEGAFLGGISAIYNNAFEAYAPNIVMQAVGLTFGVVIGMFALYKFGVIKATEKFKSIVFAATAGIAIFYLLAIVLRLFGIQMPLIHESTTMGIVFSVFVVAIAALNLILDFDRIDQGAAMGAPKYMEWYGAFGLVVTIVWLYLEILRLLSKLAKRD